MPGGQVFGFEHGGSRRFAELINRVFQIESADAPMPPGFLLETDRPEWRVLKRELTWSSSALGVAAGVGNFSRAQIINPPNSGRIVVVTAMWLTNLTAASQRVAVTTDAPRIVAGQAANVALDLRVPLQPTTRFVMSRNAIDNTLPALAGTIVDEQSSSAIGQTVVCLLDTGPVILAPNTNVDIWLEVANTAIRAFAAGYERPSTPDELAQ